MVVNANSRNLTGTADPAALTLDQESRRTREAGSSKCRLGLGCLTSCATDLQCRTDSMFILSIMLLSVVLSIGGGMARHFTSDDVGRWQDRLVAKCYYGRSLLIAR